MASKESAFFKHEADYLGKDAFGRLDPGGTEFPMMVMDGSADQGLILHEAGHIFTYGILGNNEWRSGWMDEGLTSYQTDWAQKLTPQEKIGVALPPGRLPEGYRVEAVSIPGKDSTNLDEWKLELRGRAQPIGTSAADFSEFGIYNAMIYDRAQLMYGQLRDVMGDSAFKAFLRDYYSTWALKHVDERAMKASAERTFGHALSWFFEQWVHGTGLMDYSVEGQSTTAANGGYTIQVPKGTYRIELELRPGEALARQPAETHITTSDLDARRDFVVTIQR